MSRAIVLPPDNQNCPQLLEILEQKRNDVLQITNYLEALYARLLTESAGAAALTVIADERPLNPIQAA